MAPLESINLARRWQSGVFNWTPALAIGGEPVDPLLCCFSQSRPKVVGARFGEPNMPGVLLVSMQNQGNATGTLTKMHTDMSAMPTCPCSPVIPKSFWLADMSSEGFSSNK